MKLFPEPFDLDDIERALRDDNFLSLAHFTIGREENWRIGLDQVARLIPLFEENGRDYTPVYAMASMLVRRSYQLPDAPKRLAEAPEKLRILSSRRASLVTSTEGGSK